MRKRATIKDVAKEAGVSAATISYVLSGKANISAETKARVQKAVEKLEYVPNLSARGLANNDSHLIGVVIPQTEPGSELLFSNGFYSEIVSSIEYYARQENYHILISGTDADESYFNLAKQRDLNGIIAIGVPSESFYCDVKKTGIPVVLIDSYFQDYYFHNVKINDRYGAYLAVKHLIDNGHRRIAIITGNMKEHGVVRQRYHGYVEALEEAGIAPDPNLLYMETVDYEAGMRMAEKLVKDDRGATAVFCQADILAIGAMKGFAAHGVRIPQDISVIGFDDLNLAQYITPGLTTIHQDIPLKGETAVRMLMSAIHDPSIGMQEETLPLRLIERESVQKLGQP